MASKLQNISALSNEIGKSLADYEKWTAFLKSAAWQYKYPFQDQILIYAQRPDATACASIDVWNKKLKAWINRGSKGIALLREGDRGKYLDYVFDISDTHSNDGPIRLWQYNNRFDDAIIETLENSFGELKKKSVLRTQFFQRHKMPWRTVKPTIFRSLNTQKKTVFWTAWTSLILMWNFSRRRK